ncbi:hypothetical protein LCGC14_1734230 [marine sediment metagenome]|uniref:Uncharacterized protein n=1 Tax=marine sediment metagenome TaxID=412755 RepID=A0A0F9HWD4_9ZZZZ
MLIKCITYDNDNKVHIQSPFYAGTALCGKDAFRWHNSKREPTCRKCLDRQKERPFLGEKVEKQFDARYEFC